MSRLTVDERMHRLRSDYELLISEARLELEATERLAASQRANLVEIESGLSRLSYRAGAARRPRHLLPGRLPSLPPVRDGERDDEKGLPATEP